MAVHGSVMLAWKQEKNVGGGGVGGIQLVVAEAVKQVAEAVKWRKQ